MRRAEFEWYAAIAALFIVAVLAAIILWWMVG